MYTHIHKHIRALTCTRTYSYTHEHADIKTHKFAVKILLKFEPFFLASVSLIFHIVSLTDILEIIVLK